MGLADGQAWEKENNWQEEHLENITENNIEKFIKFADDLVQNNTNWSKIEASKGRKYIKLIMCRKEDGSQKSCWAFVNKETGEIFKPATWSAPAKHARGNVNDPSTYESYQWTGPHYRR